MGNTIRYRNRLVPLRHRLAGLQQRLHVAEDPRPAAALQTLVGRSLALEVLVNHDNLGNAAGHRFQLPTRYERLLLRGRRDLPEVHGPPGLGTVSARCRPSPGGPDAPVPYGPVRA